MAKPVFVTVVYRNGIDAEKDRYAMEIAANHGAKLVGSGCYLQNDMERDLEFQTTKNKAKDFISALNAVGLQTEFLASK